MLSLLFFSPSWLPEPDAQYKVDNISFVTDLQIHLDNASATMGEPVTLPHDWRKLSRDIEAGWYEFTVDLSHNSEEAYVLYISHVQQYVDIWIDDVRIGNQFPDYQVDGRMWNRPVLITVPEKLLDSDRPKIYIHLYSEPVANALLGNVYFGPASKLRPAWEWRYHYRFTLVAIITFGMLFLSIFMAVLWLLRQRDTMYGWFMLCTFSWSLHNIPHVVRKPDGIAAEYWDGIYFVLLGWVVFSLIIFNHRYIGNIYPKQERYLLLYGVLGSIPFFFMPQEWIHIYSYTFWDLLLLPLGLYTVIYLIIAHVKESKPETRLLILAGIIILGFGLNDYLVTAGLIDRTRGLMIQFSGLPAMLVLIWLLLSRFINVLAESESLNLELEQRVNSREIELEENYQRLRMMEQERLLSDERDRIMQDVHDGVGGQLVTMLAELEKGKITHDQLQEALSESLMDLRLVIDSLDSAGEDLPTLLGMLRTRMQPRLDGHNIKLHWQVDTLPVLQDFGPGKALHLMRILQEAVTNVIKHSGATNLHVVTDTEAKSDTEQTISIKLIDDGSWMDPEDDTGHGLKNMHKRARGINAELAIDSTSSGTTITIKLTGKTIA